MQIGNRLRGLAVAVVAALAFAPVNAVAQDDVAGDPVIVVSVTNMDRLMKDVNYVTSALEQPQAGGMFTMMTGMYTNGLDRSRPIGIAFPMVNQMPAPLAFLPTDDVAKVLKPLEAMVGPPESLDDGTMALAAGPNLIYIKQVGDWAYVAQSRDLLGSVPEDPSAWLGTMGDDYDLGVRFDLTALSPEQRAMAVSLIRQGFDQALAQQPPEQAEQIRQVGEQSLEQLETVINETETLQIGFAIQPEKQQLMMQISSTAVPGTELAAMMEGQKSIPSKFASVLQPGAAAYIHSASSISSMGIEQARLSLEQATGSVRSALEQAEGLSPEDQAELEAFFDRIIEIGIETVEEGKSDMGGLVSLDNQQLNVVAGFFVSDGDKVAALAKELSAKIDAKTGGNSPLRFSFDAAEHKGITLHYAEADVPSQDEKAQRAFGDKLKLVIGTGDDAVYLAFGPQGENLLKGLINSADGDTSSDRPLGQGQIKLLPILEFAQSIEANAPLAAMIDSLAQYDDSDSLGFVSKSIDRGSVADFTIGEGILRAIGAAIRASQPQAQPAF